MNLIQLFKKFHIDMYISQQLLTLTSEHTYVHIWHHNKRQIQPSNFLNEILHKQVTNLNSNLRRIT